MRVKPSLLTMLGCAAVLLMAISPPAHADTLPFASGVDSNGGADGSCFSWSTVSGAVGLTHYDNGTGGCISHYYLPLYWRNFYSASTTRTITVRGRRPNSASDLDCSVFVFDTHGNLVSSNGGAFPVTGSNYGTLTFNVTNVSAAGTSVVSCTPKGTSLLLNVSWSP